jgi:hypothetical protein
MAMRSKLYLLLLSPLLFAAPLRASLSVYFQSVPASVDLGQVFTVTVQVASGSQPIGAISPTAMVMMGTASAMPLAGSPSPASMSLSATSSGIFTFSYSAVGCGYLQFSVTATGIESGLTVTASAGPSSLLSIVCPSPSPTASPASTEALAPSQGNAKVRGNKLMPLMGGMADFDYSLPFDGQISIQIFGRDGSRVHSVEHDLPAGSYTETWDGRNDQGAYVSSGVYVAIFRAKGLSKQLKIVVIK